MKKRVECNVTVGTSKWRCSANSRLWLHGFSWWIYTAIGTVMSCSHQQTRTAARRSGLAAAKSLGFVVVRRRIRPPGR